MNTVLPGWIDQVQGVDFTPEKELLGDLEQWAAERVADVFREAYGRQLAITRARR